MSATSTYHPLLRLSIAREEKNQWLSLRNITLAALWCHIYGDYDGEISYNISLFFGLRYHYYRSSVVP